MYQLASNVTLVDQPQLTKAFQPFAVSMVAARRGQRMATTTDRADPRLDMRRPLEWRHASGIQNVIT